MLFIAGRTGTATGKGLKFHVTPTKIEHTSSLMVVVSRFIDKILLNNNIKTCKLSIPVYDMMLVLQIFD